MKKKLFKSSLTLLAAGLLAMGVAATAQAAVNVRVQPSGPDIPSSYVLSGEGRTYFGNVEGAASYEYRWEFSNGGDTGWAAVANARYIAIDHTFATSGLHWARLIVRDPDNPTDTETSTIEVEVLAVDTLNRQKNSAVDRGLRQLYQMETTGAGGSSWGSSYPVAETAMALVAFENHRHNLEADDEDIYKRSVEEGLKWLFNHAYEVQLSDQVCIGDPEGTPGDPSFDDLDADNDGYGVTFSTSGSSITYSEGYEMPLAMLAIANSCEKTTALGRVASSSSSTFVNGLTYWDIMVDAKDFLAFALTESGGGGSGFSDYCDGYNGSDAYYFSIYNYNDLLTDPYTFLGYNNSIYTANGCSEARYKFIYGDGSEEIVSPDYCVDYGDYYPDYPDYDYLYMYKYAYHTYASCGEYPASMQYSVDGGATWQSSCSIEVDVPCSAGGGDCPDNGSGWRYSRNYGSVDNSVTQWPTLALEEAQERWDIFINPKVKETVRTWLAYSQGDTSGGFCYDYPDSWENFAKTGAGLAMLKWVGYSAADTNVQNALTFLDNHWADGEQGGNLGTDYYGMYAFYKGMKYLGVNDLGGRDWEDLYTEFLVGAQQADGSWTNSGWLSLPSPHMSTEAALAMLAPAVGGLPPVAEADGPYGPVNPGQLVMLDGSGSFHQDPTGNIVKYEWDFNSVDGLWWASKALPDPGEGAIGITPTTSYPDTGAATAYTVTLRVTDDSIPAKTDTDSSTVSVTTGNVPPVAVTNGPWAGVPGDTLTFDGTGSYDPNACTDPANSSCLGDTIVSYEWDLDGDGNWNEPGDDGTPVVAGNYSAVTKTYPNPVSQTVTLRVTDSHGLTDLTSPQVNIVSVALVYGQEYDYCYRQVISRFEYKMGVKVLFSNLGNDTAENVVVTLTDSPTNMAILSSVSALGTMAPGDDVSTQCDATAMDADIELLFDRRIVAVGDWRWKAEFDLGGQHYILNNLPPLGP